MNARESTGLVVLEGLLSELRTDGTHPDVERWRADVGTELADYARRGPDEAAAVARVAEAFALCVELLRDLANPQPEGSSLGSATPQDWAR
jgi:hypothetical protein